MHACACVHGEPERGGEGRVRETVQKPSGLVVMGFGVILIFFFKLLSIFKIFNNDYVLLFELEKKNP